MPLSKTDQNLGTAVTLLAIALFMVYLILAGFGMRDERALLGTAVMFVIAIALAIYFVRKLRKENNPLAIDYFNVGAQRHILGLFMIFYGIPKLYGGFFDYQLFALDSKLGNVSEFELAWYFYGKNRWQELVSGIMEFVPGILLFHRRTYYVAAVLLLPVTAQVFILNTFFKIGGITFQAAVVLLLCNVYILYSEKEKILQFIRSLDFTRRVTFSNRATLFIRIVKWVFILLAAFTVFRRTKAMLFKTEVQRKYEALVGMYSLEAMKKNGEAFMPSTEERYYKDLYIERQSRWNILRKFDNTTDAFIIDLNKSNDSIRLYINKGGIGDSPDIKDEKTVLRGTYSVEKELLIIDGVQLGDTLKLTFKRQALKPKEWFW